MSDVRTDVWTWEKLSFRPRLDTIKNFIPLVNINAIMMSCDQVAINFLCFYMYIISVNFQLLWVHKSVHLIYNEWVL
jgi:hypothetical protein